MKLRNAIFTHVFDWLCQNEYVDGQKALSKRTGISENTITNILKGRTDVSDQTLRKLNDGFGGIFNMQYLRGIDSSHMLISDFMDDSGSMAPFASQVQEPTSYEAPSEQKNATSLIDLAALLIKEVEALRMQLVQEISENRALRAQLTQSLKNPNNNMS